ncbi:MAG: aldose 1-epimerase family protein [Chitinophagaceae bacterium]|nr:MAG: aldose 1-epimerase family protein [Chitinophagaceae bacterium]
MPVIENEFLEVTIDPKGAELKKIFHKQLKLDYLWNADPAFWAKSSPVLFPVVGTLKKDTMYYDGKPYNMGRHGFARDSGFSVEKQEPSSVSFLLVSDKATLGKYPFDFEFRVYYELKDNALSVSYDVRNPSQAVMYFSVGAHPAFKIPLTDDEQYTDYYIEFEKPETAGRWLISPDGLIESSSTPLLAGSNRLPLEHSLFYRDAIVLKGLESAYLSLRNTKSTHGLRFDFPGFPYMGIWAARDADFVCIEPWCGIADSVGSDQQFISKEGINRLEAGGKFERTWTAAFF